MIKTIQISVIIPVYKTEFYLRGAIDSLMVSCPQDGVEIIVVNDGSPGTVEAIVNSYNDSRLHYINHGTNLGLLNARLTGANVARGQWLTHFDPDDIASSDYFDLLLEQIDADADLVEFNAMRVRAHDSVLVYRNRSPKLSSGRMFEMFLNKEIIGNVWNKMYKKDVWKKTFCNKSDCNGITLAEDYIINIFYLKKARGYRFVNKRLVFYMVRDGSASKAFEIRDLNNSLNQIKRGYVYLMNNLFEILDVKEREKVLDLFFLNIDYSVIQRIEISVALENMDKFDHENIFLIYIANKKK